MYKRQAYRQLIAQTREELENYNKALSVVDQAYNRVQAIETTLKQFSEGMLIAVAYRYGKDSHEYEMAGGVRRRERRRSSAPAETVEIEPMVDNGNGLPVAEMNGSSVN